MLHTMTVTELDAAVAAGVITTLDYVSAMRRAHRATWEARQVADRHAVAVERSDHERAVAARVAYSYSDEGLAEVIAHGEAASPGPYRQALILVTVHPEDRATVVARAHQFRNGTPDAGRWSDAVRSCAGDPDVRRQVVAS